MDYVLTHKHNKLSSPPHTQKAYPLDLVRTRLAVQTRGGYYAGVLGSLKRIAADEGVAGLYKGLGATLVQVVPSLALSFTAYETARGWAAAREARLRGESTSGGGSEAASSSGRGGVSSGGGNGGGAAGGGGGEWDLAQAVAQRPDGGGGGGSSGSSSSPSTSAAAAGAVAPAAASSSGGARGGPLARPPPISPAASLACGCLSGVVTATATFPLDVVRRRMQVAGSGRAGGGASYGGVLRQILRERGVRGLYAGLTAEYCKVVPGVAIAYGTYEAVKRATEAD